MSGREAQYQEQQHRFKTISVEQLKRTLTQADEYFLKAQMNGWVEPGINQSYHLLHFTKDIMESLDSTTTNYKVSRIGLSLFEKEFSINIGVREAGSFHRFIKRQTKRNQNHYQRFSDLYLKTIKNITILIKDSYVDQEPLAQGTMIIPTGYDRAHILTFSKATPADIHSISIPGQNRQGTPGMYHHLFAVSDHDNEYLCFQQATRREEKLETVLGRYADDPIGTLIIANGTEDHDFQHTSAPLAAKKYAKLIGMQHYSLELHKSP